MKKIIVRGVLINGLILLFACLYAIAFTVSARWGLGLFDCHWKATFGINCPGCGGSRAVLALLRFDLFSALYYSPGVVLGALLLLWYDLTLALALFRRDASFIQKFPVVSLALVPVVFLLTFLVRLYLTLAIGLPPI
ncbi:MAG: DUF2752 domain-containing protein [Clostridia bacterium]|nr:DUF2752 domain-containing protein [Clostridia bacterium]